MSRTIEKSWRDNTKEVNDFEMVTYRRPTYDHDRLRKVASYAHGKVLDIGFNQNPNPFLKVDTGIDINVQSRPKNYRRVVKVSAQRFTDVVKDKFDTIIAAGLMENQENPSKFLRECHKALNDNGTLVITNPNPYYLPYVFFELLNNKRYFFRGSVINLFPPRIMFKLLKYTGFKIKKIEKSIFNYTVFYVCEKVK